jgi:hypothetical protein
MRAYVRVIAVASIAAGLGLAQDSPALAGCIGLSGTADGWDKQTAVTRAQAAVDQAVVDYKTQKRLGPISVSAMKAKPQPYWRGSVSAELYRGPDIVTGKSYTVCWTGVISPYVCTSGSKICW